MQTSSLEQIALYRDSTQPVEARVADLLARMTLDEKLAQLGSAWIYELADPERASHLMRHGIGQITRIGGASNLKPAESAAAANAIQRFLVEQTRLGIPAMVHEECCAGYMARDATVFPQIIGLASTWQPELANAMAGVVRTQMRAVGAHQGLSPVLDVVRDPRWGRVEETFGEDAYLVASMGVAYVRGLQTEDWRQGVIATGKHFVGYGLTDGGFNWNPAHIPPRELREVFLRPFEAAVREAGLYSIMNGYNELDGVPCAASHELLTEILREQWGFEGLVVSDYFAVDQLQQAHLISSDKGSSARMALQAGIDVELPSTDCYGEPLRRQVEQGKLDVAVIDTSVARVLRTKFQLGLFENPFVDEAGAAALFDTATQRGLARRIGQQSMVLLKNEDNLLPLARSLGSVAVIGPNAGVSRNLVGDYTYICHVETLIEAREKDNAFGAAIAEDIEIVEDFVSINSVVEAIRLAVSSGTTVHFAQGCDVNSDRRDGFAEAVEAAKQADVAIVVVGDKSGLTDDCTSGEARDRADLDLPGVQQQLVEAVVATGTPTVVVLVNGRPLSINWIAEHVPAIVEAWLPGEEGGGAIRRRAFWRSQPGRQAAHDLPALRWPGADLLRAQAVGRTLALEDDLCRSEQRAALPLWLRAELYDLRAIRFAARSAVRRGRPDCGCPGGSDQHRRLGRRRGGAVLRSQRCRQRHAAVEGARGLLSSSPDARGKTNGHFGSGGQPAGVSRSGHALGGRTWAGSRDGRHVVGGPAAGGWF